jgi:hypothetical protein
MEKFGRVARSDHAVVRRANAEARLDTPIAMRDLRARRRHEPPAARDPGGAPTACVVDGGAARARVAVDAEAVPEMA